jgi:hypothetical protein
MLVFGGIESLRIGIAYRVGSPSHYLQKNSKKTPKRNIFDNKLKKQRFLYVV